MLIPATKLIIFLTAFLVGTAFGGFLNLSWVHPAYLVLFLLLGLVFRKNKVVVILIFLFGLMLGFWRLSTVGERHLVKIAKLQYGKAYKLEGMIASEPEIKGKVQSFKFEAGDTSYLVTTNQFPLYQYGQGIVLVGELEKASSERLVGEGLAGLFFYPGLKKTPAPKLTKFEALRKELIVVKAGLMEKINYFLPEPASGLVNGVLFGSRSGLSDTWLGLLMASGTIHIIALSGFNISIIVDFFRRIFAGTSRTLAFWLPVIGILLFLFSTAFSASVVRAAIFGLFLLLARYLGRQEEPLISISLAAGLMVFQNPYVLTSDIGFQLSFAAFVGLVYLAPLIKPLLVWSGFLADDLAVSLAATLATLPILSYHFGRFSLVAPLANLFIIPFVPWLMLSGILVAILGFGWPLLAKLMAVIPWLISDYIFKAAELFGKLRFAQYTYEIKTATLILGYYLVIIELGFIFRSKLWKRKNS